MFSLKDFVARLTDNYTKDPDSNMGKIIRLFQEQIQQLDQSFSVIADNRDENQAAGKWLDTIGKEVGQPRGKAADEVYRMLIKSKRAKNRSHGEINTIIQVLADALQVPVSDVKVVELFNSDLLKEPAAFLVKVKGYEQLNKTTIDAFSELAGPGIRMYFQPLSNFTELSGWGEDITHVGFSCPIPNEELYSSDELYPC
ncbi:hypothetical protein ABE354_16020 [Brevibacillus laterosporus]|uniref:hypothetical protein n=1 Tax=Brevibacillus laterosporus TaxID=1465 RepID=UPI003D1F79C4